jgi:galactose mutarotase-like enzyme
MINFMKLNLRILINNMHTLKNKAIEISVNEEGAELCHLLMDGIEYIWQADPKYWARYAPVLFPIVGALKDGKYYWRDKEYMLPQHGFARDRKFELIERTEDSLSFLLKYDDQTLSVFPFKFHLIITYQLINNELFIRYKVENLENDTMYFSIGAHPAFRCPLVQGESYQDYYLEFEIDEIINRWFIDNSLLTHRQTTILDNEKVIPLNRKKFVDGALILKNLKSSKITYKSGKSKKGIVLNFNGFPFLGLWAQAKADFICIEPWYGICDRIDSNQRLENKEGIQKLDGNQTFECVFSIRPLN